MEVDKKTLKKIKKQVIEEINKEQEKYKKELMVRLQNWSKDVEETVEMIINKAAPDLIRKIAKPIIEELVKEELKQ